MDPLEDLPMIGVTFVPGFLRSPPPYFQVHRGIEGPVVKHDRARVNVCIDKYAKWFSDSMGSNLRVTSVEEYDSLVQRLLSRPLFFDVALWREWKYALSKSRTYTKADVFVTVNTAHPAIKSQLERALEEARPLVGSGRKFSLKISFSTVLQQWYRQLLSADEGSCTCVVTDATKATIAIGNTSELFRPFGCGLSLCEGINCSILCFPCFLLTAPCYGIHRYLTTADRKCKVEGEVDYLRWINGVPQRIDEIRIK